jgi:hypothetical protein
MNSQTAGSAGMKRTYRVSYCVRILDEQCYEIAVFGIRRLSSLKAALVKICTCMCSTTI